MPIAIAYTRQLLQTGKATLVLHYALTIVWLAQLVPEPSLRPVLLGVTLHRQVEYTDSTVMGIGQATHSSRKLTLINSTAAGPAGVTWQHIVVSPCKPYRYQARIRSFSFR